MTMIIALVALALVAFVLAAARFGADSRMQDTRQRAADWPGVRHCS